ncbi:MAG: response regulator, partial [Candidatus Aureabacteria bacterium]|nr:response regulator [Candidatus Auribacterota bacterium]
MIFSSEPLMVSERIVIMKPHVLIVEDVENQRESLSDILCEEGYNVFTAADGVSALRTIGEQLIDVAIVDIKLP